MANKRTIYLGLDYSQFTGGVTEINRKMSLLDAEFKLAKEQAKNYGTATDELGVKQEYLGQKIALQAQKVEEAKKAYDAAMSSTTATQKEIDALDKKLLQERTTLEKLNGELKTTDKSMEDAEKETKSFGDEIRGLAGALGVNVSPALEKLASKFDNVDAAAGKRFWESELLQQPLLNAAWAWRNLQTNYKRFQRQPGSRRMSCRNYSMRRIMLM